MHARPSLRCSLAHAWLLEVESKQLDSKQLDDLDMGLYWDAKGIENALCIIPGEDAEHVIEKGGRTLQYLQVLSGTLIGVVDQSNGTSLVQMYGRRKGRNIVHHFLSCLKEEFYGVWVCLSEHWAIRVEC